MKWLKLYLTGTMLFTKSMTIVTKHETYEKKVHIFSLEELHALGIQYLAHHTFTLKGEVFHQYLPLLHPLVEALSSEKNLALFLKKIDHPPSFIYLLEYLFVKDEIINTVQDIHHRLKNLP